MTGAPIILSEGGHADLGAVMAVMDDSFDPRFGEAWTHAQCAGLLPMPGVWLTLARESEAVLGFALARFVADEAELLLLAVRAAAQRRGIGRILIEDFEDEAAGARRRRACISKSAKEIMPLAFTSERASASSAGAATTIAARKGTGTTLSPWRKASEICGNPQIDAFRFALVKDAKTDQSSHRACQANGSHIL